ncbi:hypothetical protein ACFLRU_02620 [Bacteroidota bacterium]
MKKNISHLFFKQQQQLQIFIYVLVGVLLVYRGVYTAPDSGAFLRMEFNRSPLYCSFLKLFTFTFGEFYQYPLLITQYLLLVFSSKFLLNTLNKEMRFNKSTILLTQIFILIPCLYLHHTSRAVLSESIAYPFLLIIISFSLKAFYYINLRPLFYAVPFLSLLLLTRGQFLILLPLFFFLTVYISFKNKKIKKGLGLLGILILIPVFNGIIEKSYNKLAHGRYINNAMSYVHLITASFYVSEDSDVVFFKDNDEIAYFNIISNSLIKNNLTYLKAIENGIDPSEHYKHNFSKICNARIHELGLAYFANKGLSYFDQNIALNKLCKKMVFPLLKNNFKRWCLLSLKNFKNTFGVSKLLLLNLLLFSIAFIQFLKKENAFNKFVVLSMLFMFANNLFISLTVHHEKRYLFYYDWLILTIIVLLLFKKTFKKEI